MASGGFYPTPGNFLGNRNDSFYENGPIALSSAGSPSSTSYDDFDEASRNAKRTPKACDRCRHKKTKCTGDSPCQRCRLDNTVCSYTHRRPKEGPNFNPQVAQKDAAMSMLYKCIDTMNQELLRARLGPYIDPSIAAAAESEEFIIGVILDRFHISPILDEFDNQPVYLPGQKGFDPGNCAIEFPQYRTSANELQFDPMEGVNQPTASFTSHLHPEMMFGSEMDVAGRSQRPRPKKRRTDPAAPSTPELVNASYGYESSPERICPATPGHFSTDSIIDDTFHFLNSASLDHNLSTRQMHDPRLQSSNLNTWGYEPLDESILNNITNSQDGLLNAKGAVHHFVQQRNLANAQALQAQQAKINQIRRGRQALTSPPSPEYQNSLLPGGNPLPAYLMQNPVIDGWEFTANSNLIMPATSSPRMMTMRNASRGQSPHGRIAVSESSDASMIQGGPSYGNMW